MPLELARTPEQSRQAIAEKLRNSSVADDRIREHVRIVAGPQPYDHSHFAADRYFQFDSSSAVVTNVYGQRMLRVTGNLLRTLRGALKRELGDGAAAAMYDIGVRWAEADMKSFMPRIEQEYECRFEKLAMGAMLESWWWPFRAAGWGVWRYDFAYARCGLVVVELNNSATVETKGECDKPACDLYAGLYAAVFGDLAQRELACVELECTAKGDASCRFLVAAKKRIEAARTQRDAGAPAAEIVAKLETMPSM